MATKRKVSSLAKALKSISDRMMDLSSNDDPTVAQMAASLSLRLVAAMHAIAFGPSEWAAVDDAKVDDAITAANAEIDELQEPVDVHKMIDAAVALNTLSDKLTALA